MKDLIRNNKPTFIIVIIFVILILVGIITTKAAEPVAGAGHPAGALQAPAAQTAGTIR